MDRRNRNIGVVNTTPFFFKKKTRFTGLLYPTKDFNQV